MASEHQEGDGSGHGKDKEGGTWVFSDTGAPMESGATVFSGAGRMEIEPVLAYDFQEHERAAVTEYLKHWTFYVDLASVVARILEECLKRNQIKVHSVQHLTRLELMLLAALGERFIDRHPWKTSEWFTPRQQEYLQKFNEDGIRTSIYDPISENVVLA